MMPDSFSLKWNDFQTSVSNSLGIFRKEKDFFDVTLVSDDEIQISAHKLVLSACSDFFKSILKRNSHSHPLLYLSGVDSSNLSLIVDYIYHGEVQVYHEDLDSFLKVAQKLKIEGLITRNEDKGGSNANVKKEDIHHESLNNSDEFSPSDLMVDSETEENEKKMDGARRNSNISQPRQERTVTVNDNSELDEAIQKNLRKEEGAYYCKVCNYTGRDKRTVILHIETHIEGLSYSCPQCHKTFRTLNSRDTHIRRKHKQTKSENQI